MAGAAREVSVHRGFDPREFSLVAFGGAGPMHGFLVAEELGMSRVVVPRFPGHLSALGQMVADVRRDFVKACQTPVLVLPDDTPGHSLAVAIESAMLAPKGQLSMYPWKDTPEKIPLAVRHVRSFLLSHRTTS